MRQASKQDWYRQIRSRKTKDHTVRLTKMQERTVVEKPTSLRLLQQIIDPATGRATPIRPMGAGSSSTACNVAAGGTVIDMTALTDIVEIGDRTVTVQAGIRLRELADVLSERGMELPGSLDLISRTVGGAVASACIGPSSARDGALFASQVVAMKIVTPSGELLTVDETRNKLLDVYRLSYGLLGVIYEVTLRIRPMTPFTRTQRKMSIKAFGSAAARLAGTSVGLKFYLMPFKGQVYTELRRHDDASATVHSLPWKLKDWGESTVLPAICGKLSRVVPLASVRYSLADSVNGMGQSLLNSRLVSGGSSAVEQRNQASGSHPRPPLNYSTWCFPAPDVPMVLSAYQDFCQRYYKANRFRCDMPTVGFKLATDRSALLSPSFDEPMFALRAISTPHAKWEDFAMEFAEFGQTWGGVPFFNQTRCVEMSYASKAFGSRLEFFRKFRNRIDPDNRLLNPFLAQYFC